MKTLLIAIIILSTSVVNLFATHPPFPYGSSTQGMGAAFSGVAVNNDDIGGFLINPAQSSLFTESNRLKFRYGLSDRAWESDNDYHNLILTYNCAHENYGFGYGAFYRFELDRDYYWEYFKKRVKSTIPGEGVFGFNASAYYGNKVRIAGGLTYKTGYGGYGKSRLDLGADLTAKIMEQYPISSKLNLDLSTNIGFAILNFIPSEDFDSQGPLVSRLGYSINFGVNARLKNSYINIFKTILTAENINDHADGYFYEVWQLNRLFSIQNKSLSDGARGIILSFGDFLTLGTNQINDKSYNNARFIGISSDGIFKIMDEISPSPFVTWMNRNLSISYSYAMIKNFYEMRRNRSYNIDFTFKNIF
jgi:hypothetical protein